MRRIKNFVFLWMVVACSSCINYHDMPKSLKFPKEGGTLRLHCDEANYGWSIRTYNGSVLANEFENYEILDEDSMPVAKSIRMQGEWLTLKIDNYGMDWELTASPNPSGHSRKLYIDYTIPPDYIDMKISQK